MNNFDKMNEKNLEKHRKREQKRKEKSRQNLKSALKQMTPHYVVILCLLASLIAFLCCNHPYLNEKDLSSDSGKCVSIEQVSSGIRKFNNVVTLDNGNSYYIELNTSMYNFSYDEFKQIEGSGEEVYIKYSKSYSKNFDCYEIAELYSKNQEFISLKTTNGYRILTWICFLAIYTIIGGGYLYIVFLKKHYK